MRTAYSFNYCYPIKSGDLFFDFNEYELYNGGPNGDLWCAPGTITPTIAGNPWRPKQAAGYYDRTKKPGAC